MEVKEEKVPTSLNKNKNDMVFEEKTNPNRQSPNNRSKPVFRFMDSSLTNNYAASSNTPNPFAFKQTPFVSQLNRSDQANPSLANTSNVRNPTISVINLLKLYQERFKGLFHSLPSPTVPILGKTGEEIPWPTQTITVITLEGTKEVVGFQEGMVDLAGLSLATTKMKTEGYCSGGPI